MKYFLQTLLQPLKRSLMHLVYPAHCLHCHISLRPEAPLLCQNCLSLLELLNPLTRCLTCFNQTTSTKGSLCDYCLRFPSLYIRTAAAFDYQGPAASLVKQLKYANQPYLAQGMAAFLVAQWVELKWPFPDVLIPVPLTFSHWWERGYNQSALLAQEMGKLLDRPVWNVLKRAAGDYSQAALSFEQRQQLKAQTFKLKSNKNLQDKKILVIDDVQTSGATLMRCAEALSASCPSHLYALTFCRTDLDA